MIQSIGWIVYTLSSWQPLFFVMKRRALSGKIERVAPKGKPKINEQAEYTCVREVSEETGMDINSFTIKTKLSGWVELKNMNFGKWSIDKSISYFLVYYNGNPTAVNIADTEWHTWQYKRATLSEILTLVPYKDLRAVFREAHNTIQKYIDKQNMINTIAI